MFEMPIQEMMSPICSPTQELTKITPCKTGISSIHPSPNRTEAAAAMMHLLSGSKSKEATIRSTLHSIKTKRRYMRRAPKKIGTSAKRQIKTAWIDSDAIATGKPPIKSNRIKALEDEDNDPKIGEWQVEGDDAKSFPFREYSRKDKSLGLLCENFLKLYREDQIPEICLDRAATELGVERRRIYDIVNILESIHLVSRKSKNLYNWHGLMSLPTSISEMKQYYADVQNLSTNNVENQPTKGDRRRGKSLSKLSQMFVQLFLEKEDCIIPLDEAAKQLIQMEDSESEEDRLLKTKIRRLYDVANVLVSVGLIEKLQLSSSRKPVFRWKVRSSVAIVSPHRHRHHPFAIDKANSNEPVKPLLADIANSDIPPLSTITEETDIMKTSQSCDSDMFDGSDSHSDDSCRDSKRKQPEQDVNDVRLSDGESSAKRFWGNERTASISKCLTKAVDEINLLQMDASNKPIHPRIILRQQQERVKLYMDQYVREYVAYMTAHQELSIAPTNPETSVPESKDFHEDKENT
ncbi:putative E2F Family, winged helix-like DNA-binding domain superfamily [Plasmopara halstedii]